jgi:hypothetical protein
MATCTDRPFLVKVLDVAGLTAITKPLATYREIAQARPRNGIDRRGLVG